MNVHFNQFESDARVVCNVIQKDNAARLGYTEAPSLLCIITPLVHRTIQESLLCEDTIRTLTVYVC